MAERLVHGCPRQISIHAPVRGATKFLRYVSERIMDFNPRSREGSDEPGERFTCTKEDFNPRSREGSDNIRGFFFLFVINFNPRSREGSDASKFFSHTLIQNFNPRSREGSDDIDDGDVKFDVFQSTLP